MSEPVLPPGFRWGDVVPAIATGIGLVVVCFAHAFFMSPSVQVGYDEGFEAAVVERVIAGRGLPYVDGVAQRGPFLYWTQALFHLVFGRFEWTGTRMLALGCALTANAATFLTGWAAGWPLAGAVGALINIFITCAVLAPGDGIGVHAEPVAIAYLMVGFFLLVYALERQASSRGRLIMLAAAGAFTAMCGLSKQSLAIIAVPMFLSACLHSRSVVPADQPWWKRWVLQGGVAFAGGGIALVLMVLARYALAGELKTFFAWSIGFNANAYLAPYEGRIFKTLSGWFWGSAWAMAGVSLALLTLGRPFSFLQKFSAQGILSALRAAWFELSVGTAALVILFGAAFPLRFWDHYWFPIFPVFGLLVGLFVDALFRRGRSVPPLAQAAACVAALTLAITHPTQRLIHLRQQKQSGSWQSHRPDPACAEIDRISGPGMAPIFIWGVVGDLYITCRRPSVSLFTYTTVLAGIIPPYWRPDPSRVVPGTREKLLEELSAGRPPVIIDNPISRGAAMVDIPVLAEYLNANYCLASTIQDNRGRTLTFYARLDLGMCQQDSKKKRKKKRNPPPLVDATDVPPSHGGG